MKAIGYVRVSTDEQAREGFSLDAQKDRIEAYCQLYKITLVDTIADAGRSAKNLDRPGVQRILTMIHKQEIEGVVVAKLDRLTRSVRDLADLMELANKRSVSLISVAEHLDTGSAAGRMVVNMLGTVSQWEREAIGERTSAVLQFKKRNGERYGCYPLYGFGYKGRRMVRVDGEQRVIAKILRLHGQKRSLRAIAGMLSASGLCTRNGGRWAAEQVRRIVKHALENGSPLSSFQGA